MNKPVAQGFYLIPLLLKERFIAKYLYAIDLRILRTIGLVKHGGKLKVYPVSRKELLSGVDIGFVPEGQRETLLYQQMLAKVVYLEMVKILTIGFGRV